MHQNFNVTIWQPTGYVHSMALAEAAEYVHVLLVECGYASRLSINDLSDDAHNILFCAHLLQEAELTRLPHTTIIFNSEQLEHAGGWYFQGGGYARALATRHIWDYSENNLNRIPHARKSFVPFLYSPHLIRTDFERSRDGPLLFYGSMTPHRQTLLGQLAAYGVPVQTLFGAYGRMRDEHLFRAWAVLNLHNSATITTFEPIRCFYPLINDVPVISEASPSDSTADAFRSAIFFYPPEELARHVAHVYARRSDFHEAATKKHAQFQQSNGSEFVRIAVERYLTETYSTAQPTVLPADSRVIHIPIDMNTSLEQDLPRKLNFGSGKSFRMDYLNVDIQDAAGPDFVCDMGAPFPFGSKFHTQRFGEISIQQGQFTDILADNVLEHIPDLTTAMRNCLALLSDGGVFEIIVPYDLSHGAWQDPTHVRAFNERSWLYYTDWCWYLGWIEQRFDLVSQMFVLNDYGWTLMAQNDQDLERVARWPRAVDSLHVKLRKRAVSTEERETYRLYRR